MPELLLYGLAGVCALLAYVAGYWHAMKIIDEGMRAKAQHRFNEGRDKGFSEGYRMGIGEGGRVMCMSIVQNPDMEHGYRTAAARIAKLCGHCGRTCIHCAKAAH